MHIELDMVAIIQDDQCRNELNRELREKFSRFRVVLLNDSEIRAMDRSTDAVLENLSSAPCNAIRSD